MGVPLELVKYNVDTGKFHVGEAAVEALMKVRRWAAQQAQHERQRSLTQNATARETTMLGRAGR